MGDDEASNEIHESKKTLEKILGREVPTISFPHGFYNEGHIEQARQAGYRKVFTISSALAFKNGDEYVVGPRAGRSGGLDAGTETEDPGMLPVDGGCHKDIDDHAREELHSV